MIDYSALFGTTSATQTDPLLAAIYGTGGSGSSGIDALTQLQLAEKTQTQQVAATARQPAVARDIATFRQAVASAKDPATLLQNPTVLKVLLTVNGLGDQARYTALAQKALLSNANDSGSFVRQLASASWLNATQTYNFATGGLSSLTASGAVDAIANKYAEVTWRDSLNQTTPGLSNALAFREQASTITNADQILSDAGLTDVVTNALGLSSDFINEDLTTQENTINSRLDFSQLGNPRYVEGLVQKYLLNKAQNATASGATGLDALAVQATGLVV